MAAYYMGLHHWILNTKILFPFDTVQKRQIRFIRRVPSLKDELTN